MLIPVKNKNKNKIIKSIILAKILIVLDANKYLFFSFVTDCPCDN